MFRITVDPSSVSPVLYLAKIKRMVHSCPFTWTRSVLRQHILTPCVCVYTQNGSAYSNPLCVCVHTQRVRICHNTDYVHVNGHE